MVGRAPALRRPGAGAGMMGHRLIRYILKFALMGLRPPQNPSPSPQNRHEPSFTRFRIDSALTPMLQYAWRAGVAQLVEQLFCKQQVVSSSLSTGSSIR